MKGQQIFALNILFGLLAIIAICSLTTADYPPSDSEDICRFFKNKTKIRDPYSCTEYIECIDFVSQHHKCTGTTPLYDKETEKCVRTLTNDDGCEVSCIDSAGKFVKDPKSCKGYFYCHDEELATPGQCPDLTHFDSDSQTCTYSQSSECHTENFEFCSIAKSGTVFMDAKSCNQYYSCTKAGEMKSEVCKDKYYDPAVGACVGKAEVTCLEHPLPKDVCGTVKSPKKNTFVGDGATCRGYFYCTETADGTPDENPRWGQCPPDYFFNSAKGTCVDPLDVVCTENRCDGRSLTFVVSSTTGCRDYFRCEDGYEIEKMSCGNLFFDERNTICTTKQILEPACK